MTTKFWNLFSDKIAALESAIVANDGDSLSALTNELANDLVAEHPQLNVNIGGRDPFRISILSLPGAEQMAKELVDKAQQIENWEILAALPEYDPLASVHVTRDDGSTLELRYDQLDAKVLPPKDGLATIVLSLDLEFDPAGPKSHLYHAVAENVVFTLLGGWPQELSKVVLLPRTQTGNLLPLESLRNQWLNVVTSHRSA